jgi:hypothetical protein
MDFDEAAQKEKSETEFKFVPDLMGMDRIYSPLTLQ